ncbi:MAG: protein translocase subunit SecD [Oscillospiraceae bacterium]|nr:protein translocase subunit SecD [Oscillospiraceae bacterium]
MKSVKKPVFFLVLAFILGLTYLTLFGVYTYYGDREDVWVRGVKDIRWGIDIRGGVDVIFTTPDDHVFANNDERRAGMDAARSIIEVRMVTQNITDYEIYVDYATERIIVRFPWRAGDVSFDPEQAVRELGEMAWLTFREGFPWDAESHLDLPLVIEGRDVKRAAPNYNRDDGTYEVLLELEPSGTEAFAEATGRLAGTGVAISIWMDEMPISWPTVSSQITGGNAVITGNDFTADAVISLANRINGGALPFQLEIDSFSRISPTLGESARDAMVIAGIVAFAVIAIIMIYLYRLLGVVATIGLLGQAMGALAVITGFFPGNASFTLTIPGIAGIILSIAMGVDANVITSERIKEELYTGKTLDGALQAGYKRAFAVIFDCNITLIIIAFILMGAFGTPDSFAAVALKPIFFLFGPSAAGAIYSFGFTLFVGAILNFIFGVTASRLMTYSISKFKSLRNVNFYAKGVKNRG